MESGVGCLCLFPGHTCQRSRAHEPAGIGHRGKDILGMPLHTLQQLALLPPPCSLVHTAWKAAGGASAWDQAHTWGHRLSSSSWLCPWLGPASHLWNNPADKRCVCLLAFWKNTLHYHHKGGEEKLILEKPDTYYLKLWSKPISTISHLLIASLIDRFSQQLPFKSYYEKNIKSQYETIL